MPEQEKTEVFRKKTVPQVSNELIAMLKKAHSDEEAAALLMASGVDAPQAEWLRNEFSDRRAYTGARAPGATEDAETAKAVMAARGEAHV